MKRLNQEAIVIGIDGVQFEKLSETAIPNLDKLNIIKSFTGGIKSTKTEQQTYSGTGWGTLLTGVWANKHGVVSNDKSFRANPKYPSIFEYVRNDNRDRYIASIVNWGSIHAYFEADIKSIVDFELTLPEPIEDKLAQDRFISFTVADSISNKAPDFTFVHLDNVDFVGHKFGFSPELKAIAQADSHLGITFNALEKKAAANRDEELKSLLNS